MGVEEESTANDIVSWVNQVRQRTAAEFVASYRSLFLLVYEGDPGDRPFRFDTADFESSIAKIAIAQWDQLKVRIVPIAKSPRSPYQDRISVGRASNCDIIIRHPSISKLHAHIRVGENGSYTLIDLGSHNGTRIHSRRLAPHTPEPLRVNTALAFGVVGVRTLDAGGLHTLLSRLLFLAQAK